MLPSRFEEGDYRYQKLRSQNWSVERRGAKGWEYVATINGPHEFIRLVSERLGMTDYEVGRAYGDYTIPVQ